MGNHEILFCFDFFFFFFSFPCFPFVDESCSYVMDGRIEFLTISVICVMMCLSITDQYVNVYILKY